MCFSSDVDEVSELSKIIGESYFNLEKYADAIPYLTEYKGKRGKWNNTDFYQLGYAYYKQKDYEKAISEFNKIVPSHTLKGSRSILLSLFEVCGMPGCKPHTLWRVPDQFYLVFLRFVECQDATLSHFEGVGVTFT